MDRALSGLKDVLAINRCLLTSRREIPEMQRLSSNTNARLVQQWIVRSCYVPQRSQHVQLLLRNRGSLDDRAKDGI